MGPVAGFGATIPSVPIAQAFVIEMRFTGVMGFAIMAVATDFRAPAGVAPFAIGATNPMGRVTPRVGERDVQRYAIEPRVGRRGAGE